MVTLYFKIFSFLTTVIAALLRLSVLGTLANTACKPGSTENSTCSVLFSSVMSSEANYILHTV